MFEPDLLLIKDGRPLVVVEAKTRPISPDFESAVCQPLQAYSTEIGSRWALLIDPKAARIFHDNKPVETLSTEEILGKPGKPLASGPRVIGEQTLLIAADQWLHELPHRDDVLRYHPKLQEFASELIGID